MSRCTLVLTAMALVAWYMPARADDDEGRAMILKMLKAHGGAEAINKYRAVQVKYRGTFVIMGADVKAEGEIFLSYPDRMKHVVSFEIANNTIQVLQGFDGKNGWMSIGGVISDIKDKDAVTEVKEILHAEQLSNLVGLDGKEFKFSSLGETKIKDHDAVGVRASREGNRDVNLWIDKKTHQLLKTEFRSKEPPFFQGAEINQEHVREYRKVMGILTPARIEVHYDGKKAIDMEVVEVRALERLADTHFAKP
jgi:hypothetical protein